MIREKDRRFVVDYLRSLMDNHQHVSNSLSMTVVNWVDNLFDEVELGSDEMKPIIFNVNVVSLLKVTGHFQFKYFGCYLEHLKEEITISDKYSKDLLEALTKKKKEAKTILGSMTNPKAEWPYTLFGDIIKLDWRFSTQILESTFEQLQIKSISPEKKQLQINPFLFTRKN